MRDDSLPNLLQRTHSVVESVVRPLASRVDSEAVWPAEGIAALLAARLGALVVPREQGGLGHGLHALARVCELLGGACASTALCFGMHCVASAVIAARATDDQARRFLGPIARGEHLTSLALSESGSGAHFYIPRTSLFAKSPEEFSISGSKTFVTNGGRANSYVVSTAASGEAADQGQFSCVMVPSDAPGVRWADDWNGLGMRGNSSRSLELRDVTVPRENLLGEEGDQIWYVFHVVAPYFMVAMAGTYLGITSAALDAACAHLKRRRYDHSGAALAGSTILQHRLGVIYGRAEGARQLLYHAARQGDASAPDALPLLMAAKAGMADTVNDVIGHVMTLMGGIAYADATMGRHLRDARAAHVMSPTTDLLRTWTGRALLGWPVLGD